MTLPLAQGAANTVLTNNGSGTLSWASAGSGANTTLSNLTSPTSVNQSLIPSTDATKNFGSASNRWLDGYIFAIKDSSGINSLIPQTRLLSDSGGHTSVDWENRSLYTWNGFSSDSRLTWTDSGIVVSTDIKPSIGSTYNNGTDIVPWASVFSRNYWFTNTSNSNLIRLMAPTTPTSSYDMTLPLAQGAANTVLTNNGSGTLSWASNNWSVVNGGNAAYSILAADQHVRTTTTLTADQTWTLPVCSGPNIGERHEIKNTPSQTFNIILDGNAVDLIDGNLTVTLLPGDSYNVICAVAGTWDIE
jgi:hypothetical protein